MLNATKERWSLLRMKLGLTSQKDIPVLFFVLGVTNVANRLICVGEDGDGVFALGK